MDKEKKKKEKKVNNIKILIPFSLLELNLICNSLEITKDMLKKFKEYREFLKGKMSNYLNRKERILIINEKDLGYIKKHR